MILIADSGSTKTDWCVVGQGQLVRQIVTKGMNPFFQSEEEIENEIATALIPHLKTNVLDAVYFYGAGCVPDKVPMMYNALSTHLNTKNGIEVNTDMLAVARGLCGHKPGIACIMGTGSNSCFYDGEKIVSNVSPLGFILGDEGSGAVLGKLLVGDMLKNQMTPELKEKFLNKTGLTPPEIIDRVYRQPFPNRFLASLSPFLAENILTCISSRQLQGFLPAQCHAIRLQKSSGSLHRLRRLPLSGHIARSRPRIRDTNNNHRQKPHARSHDLSSVINHKSLFINHNMFIKISEQPSLYNDLEKKSIREILEDINAEDQKVALATQKAIPQIEKLVSQIVPRMKQGGRIFYMGAGTSGRLGVLDASEIPPTFGMPPTLVIGLIAGGDTALRNPVENAEDDTRRGWEELVEHNINDKDTVIGIAASGTTPYVIGALHAAREHGILTGCITSNPDSPMAAEADVPIEMIVGPEYVTGSSRMKSGTGQKMILNMITTSVMIQLGRVKGNKMVNMQLSNQKLIDRGTRMIVEELGLYYDQAKALLLMHGSVKKAVDAYKSGTTKLP